VIGTQGGGKPEITSHNRILVIILGIGISAFLLTRRRVLHIRSSEIAKREIPLEEHFGISAFRDLGSQGDCDLKLRVLNYQFLKSQGKGNHFGISVIPGPEGRGGKEFEIEHHKLPIHEIAPAIGSGEDHSH
jgi:hypothetical protein